MKERDGIGDLEEVVVFGGNAADQDGVDGGGFVLERVENELYVGVLRDLVP